MPFFNAPDGTRLHYSDTGEGLPILCLSGLTRDGRDFSYLAHHLTGVRMITLDYRGRGQSDWPDDFMSYSVPVEMSDAVALLDHLHIDKAGIIGTSRGGLIALVMATAAPQRMLGTVLVDVGPELDSGGLAAIMDYLGRKPVWKTLRDAAEARPMVMAGFSNVPPERLLEEVRIFYGETPEGLEQSYDPRLRDAVIAAAEAVTEPPDLWPMFDALARKPLACLRGANSDLLTSETLQEMQNRAPDMIAVNVPDRGHVPFLDEPESLRAIHDWLEMLS
jgi:pimeloyl-ACP methyl ester carboxylesterase